MRTRRVSAAMLLGQATIKVLGLVLAILIAAPVGGAHAKDHADWVSAWTSSPYEKLDVMVDDPKPATKVAGSFRYYVRLALGGDQVRVRLSNELSPDRLEVVASSVALVNADGGVRDGTLRALSFNARASVLIPARSPTLSDPVNLPVRHGDLLAVTVYVSQPVRPDLGGGSPRLVQFFPGQDVTRDFAAKGAPQAFSSLVTEVDVRRPGAKGVIVTFGDSITQGRNDRPLGEVGAMSWPQELSDRLAADGHSLSVVNAGIGGNRLLTAGLGDAGLARFDRDVAAVAGATHLVVAEGINDIGFTEIDYFNFLDKPSIRDPHLLILAYQQLIARGHARGLKVIGATITPFEGSFYFSDEKDRLRQAVNAWIRSSGAYDGVIDFDAAVRDPAHPSRLLPAYDSGDHLHPSSAGMTRMARDVDLTLFR